MKLSFSQINRFMSEAFLEAQEAAWEDEVPIGAVVVSKNFEIIGRGHNIKEKEFNVSGHAEIEAIKNAGRRSESWRLEGCSLFTTLEPCPMCLSAIQQSRLESLYFGAFDFKGGAISLGYKLNSDSRLNHQFNVYGGINSYLAGSKLSNFFKAKRAAFKK